MTVYEKTSPVAQILILRKTNEKSENSRKRDRDFFASMVLCMFGLHVDTFRLSQNHFFLEI